MKKVLFILFLLFAQTVSYAQIQVINTTGAGSTNSGTSVTTTGMSTTGATLIMAVVAGFDGVAVGVMSDSRGNTWTLTRTDKLSGTIVNYTYICINPSTNPSQTFTYTKTGSFPSINVIALRNTPTSLPGDQQNGSNSAGSTSLSTGSITPLKNNEIIIASIASGNGGTISASAGFTTGSSVSFSSSQHQSSMLVYQIQTAATAISNTFSWTSSAASAVTIISVKAVMDPGGFLELIY